MAESLAGHLFGDRAVDVAERPVAAAPKIGGNVMRAEAVAGAEAGADELRSGPDGPDRGDRRNGAGGAVLALLSSILGGLLVHPGDERIHALEGALHLNPASRITSRRFAAGKIPANECWICNIP